MKIDDKEIDLLEDFEWYTEEVEQGFYGELRKVFSVLSAHMSI